MAECSTFRSRELQLRFYGSGGPHFALVDEVDDFRHPLGRDDHQSLPLFRHRGLDLGGLLSLGLIVMVFGQLANRLFRPTFR
jgi:hypothetical protein